MDADWRSAAADSMLDQPFRWRCGRAAGGFLRDSRLGLPDAVLDAVQL
ncbi:hypothetical protein ACWCQL_13145 [Streptomyces sp. NPDC002073]